VLDRAALSTRSGVDPFVGERALVALSESDAGPFAGFVLTSHKLLVGGRSVRLDEILGARQTGPASLEILTPRGPLSATTAAAPALVAFVHRIMTVHPRERAEPPRPLLSPSPGDDHGYLVEMSTPGCDMRAMALFGLLASAVRQIPQPAARDLAERAVLVSRRLRDGRGAIGDWWVSALPVPDLLGAIARVLGPPMQSVREDAAGTERALFVARGSLIVGGTEELALSIPPEIASLPATQIEVRASPLRALSTFQVRVESPDPAAVVDAPAFLFDVVAELETRLVALRTLFAWSRPAFELLDAPADAIRQKQRELAPLADLSKLLPRGEKSEAATDLLARAQAAAAIELAKPPEQRKAEARAAFAAAAGAGDEEAMWDTALKLQHAQAWDEAERAYGEIGRRFPRGLGRAMSAMADAALFSVLYAGKPVAAEHVPALERALGLYLESLRHGRTPDHVDENLWEAARALSRAHPDVERRRAAIEVYRATCPRGRNLPDADHRMRELAG
jgi:hypothetical protein